MYAISRLCEKIIMRGLIHEHSISRTIIKFYDCLNTACQIKWYNYYTDENVSLNSKESNLETKLN